jgi:hypothetical protein
MAVNRDQRGFDLTIDLPFPWSRGRDSADSRVPTLRLGTR